VLPETAEDYTLWVLTSTKLSSSDSNEQIAFKILRPSAFDGTRYLRMSVPFVLTFQFFRSLIMLLSFSASAQQSFQKPQCISSSHISHLQPFYISLGPLGTTQVTKHNFV
jgi:hypothetical protein